MKREAFLTEFLGALGAESLTFTEVNTDSISGIVHYKPSENFVLKEEEEDLIQEFCWHITEGEVPNNDVFRLAKLIHQQNLLDIDKLRISANQLREIYNQKFNLTITQQEFNSILGELEDVVVRMVDDGEETDMYFIHE